MSGEIETAPAGGDARLGDQNELRGASAVSTIGQNIDGVKADMTESLKSRRLSEVTNNQNGEIPNANALFVEKNEQEKQHSPRAEVFTFAVRDMTGTTEVHESSSIGELRLRLAIRARVFFPCILLFRRGTADSGSEPVDDCADIGHWCAVGAAAAAAAVTNDDGTPMCTPSVGSSSSPVPLTLINNEEGMKKEMEAWAAVRWIEVLEAHMSRGDGHALDRAIAVAHGAGRRIDWDDALRAIIDRSRTREDLATDTPRIRLLFELGVDVNVHDVGCRRWTILQRAVKCGHLDLVRALVAKRANINFPDNGGYTPLDYAAMGGNGDIMCALLARDERRSGVKNDDALLVPRALMPAFGGFTPLHWAAHMGHVHIISLLMEYGGQGDVNVTDNRGDTPLHLAARYGHADAITALVKVFGADRHLRNEDGCTPIQLARRGRALEVLEEMDRNKGSNQVVGASNGGTINKILNLE